MADTKHDDDDGPTDERCPRCGSLKDDHIFCYRRDKTANLRNARFIDAVRAEHKQRWANG